MIAVAGTLLGILVGAGIVLWVTDAPLYFPFGTIDTVAPTTAELNDHVVLKGVLT